MSKYFMGGTRLSGLERMMMDPSRTPPPSADFRRRRLREHPPAKPCLAEKEHKEQNV